MKSFLKKCAWFIVLIVGLNLLYLALLFWLCPEFKKTYEVSTLKNKNFELLVVGNSMAADGIDTALLTRNGIDSYNMAINGSHVSTALLILDKYLKNNKQPKVVVIGLSSAIGGSYLNKTVITNPEVEFFYHPDLIANIENPPLLNFQWLAIAVMKIIVSKDHRNAQTVRGQWKTKKVVEDHSVFKSGKSKEVVYTNPYLAKIVKGCESKGIKVILVELPGGNSNQNELPVESEVVLKGSQIHSIYNFNNHDIAGKIISTTDWLAPDHLNEKGGEKFTAYLYENVIKKEMDSISLNDRK